jgi:hypothetical protein
MPGFDVLKRQRHQDRSLAADRTAHTPGIDFDQ